jgi:hypothetical protein
MRRAAPARRSRRTVAFQLDSLAIFLRLFSWSPRIFFHGEPPRRSKEGRASFRPHALVEILRRPSQEKVDHGEGQTNE